MTTIAYRDGVMAGDRATKYGSITGHETTKVVRREDGALCGACGTTTIAAAFRRWFLAGEDAASKPSLGDDKEDIHAIIARPSGVVEIYDRMGWSVIEGDFHAIGSGTEIALGAMAMGAGAAKAVRIAATFGVGDVRSIDVVAALEAPAQPLDELRTVPGAEEEVRDQTQAFEIPDGFTRWDGGEWTGLPTDRVQVIFCDEPTPYFPTEAENLDPLWCWERCPPDAQRIIAYRVVEAPAPEQDASVESEPVYEIIVGEPWSEDPTATAIAAYIEAENAEPTPYAEAIEKGAITQDEVLDATELPQVTIDKVPPTAEVIRDQDGRAKFALFSGQTHEVVSGSGNPDADFWAQTLHPKPKVDA